MSQYYELGTVTLWNPSNGASRLFLRQVRLFEEELGLPSGIGPMEADECQITVGLLANFLDVLLVRRASTHHAVIQALSDGFIATMIVVAERAGIEVRWPVPDAPVWGVADVWGEVREHARRLALQMAR
ncbi:DUF6086 family protein [Nocardia sp. NPDC058666]|uniref:DUF6086 family protein n=1 Tax=Nocardia sp. NPDC058666 TaxID=3346587 RepID=UPI003662668B